MTDIQSPKEKREEQLVKNQGDAYQASYDMLMEEDPHVGKEVNDYFVTASFEPAEGMYIPDIDKSLIWRPPSDEDNQHVEVIVRDRKDKRFIPQLLISMKLYDKNQKIVFNKEIPFIWHPFVYHYGTNGSIPDEGVYVPEVTIAMPLFHRHDEVRGERYTKDVMVKLDSVHLTPGKKPYGPE